MDSQQNLKVKIDKERKREREREREREKEMSGGRNERSQRGMNGNKLSLHLKMKK